MRPTLACRRVASTSLGPKSRLCGLAHGVGGWVRPSRNASCIGQSSARGWSYLESPRLLHDRRVVLLAPSPRKRWVDRRTSSQNLKHDCGSPGVLMERAVDRPPLTPRMIGRSAHHSPRAPSWFEPLRSWTLPSSDPAQAPSPTRRAEPLLNQSEINSNAPVTYISVGSPAGTIRALNLSP